MTRRCYAMRLAWDGAAFDGWQRAPGVRSIQTTLEEALICAGCPARVEGASRTDRGVHARGAVASFSSSRPLEIAQVEQFLATALPPSVRVPELREATPRFRARWNATGKTYLYTVALGPPHPRAAAWMLPDARAFEGCATFDLDQGRAALRPLLGARDISPLATRGSRRGPMPGLDEASLDALAPGVWLFTLSGPAFPRHGARNIVGAAVGAALGALPVSALAETLAGARPPWWPRAPARGLCLWEVRYPAHLDPFAPFAC